jgi:hypothetical protein
MNLRLVGALVATPLVAGIIATVSFLAGPSAQVGPREWVQIGAWVVFGIVFELVVLLPLSRLSRSWKYQRLGIVGAGAATWSVLSFVWFLTVFNASATEALLPTLHMGLAGIIVCSAFVVFWRRSAVIQPVRRKDTDA